MNETHSRQIAKNIAWGLSTWILPILLGLIVTRIVVRSLGHADYGIYALVLGFIAYSFNFSVGRAITRYLASYRASGETQKIRGMISATAAITVGLAVVGSALILLLSPWLVTDVFEIEPTTQAKTIEALRISAATISVVMIGQVATAVLQGLHRFDVFSKIQNANSMIMMLGNLFLAYSGYGLLALLYWNLIAAVLTTVAAFVSARKLLPEFGVSTDFGRETLSLVTSYSAGVVGYQVTANAFFLFERSWIIGKLGAEALTFYVIPMTIGIYMHGFILSLNMVLFPLASEIGGDRDRLLRLYRAATKAVLFVVVILSASLLATGKLFLTLWMGPEFGERSATLLTFHTIAFGIAALAIVSFQTAEGLGHPGFNFRNTLVGVVAAFPVILWLTDPLGSLGVAYGRVIVFIVPFLGIFDAERRYLGSVQSAFWARNGVRFGLAAIAVFMSERFLTDHLPETWMALFISIGTGVVVYVTVLYLFRTLTSDDRALLRRLLSTS